MDDNIWEYPFGELDDDEDPFFEKYFRALSASSPQFLSLDQKRASVAYNKFR